MSTSAEPIGKGMVFPICFATVLAFGVINLPLDVVAEEREGANEAWVESHERGLELYHQQDFEGALGEFERAQSQGAPAPNLYNLARSYQQLGRLRMAVLVFDRYLEAQDIPDERRGRARQHREEASSRLARVEVRTAPLGASISVEGHDDLSGVAPMMLTLDPGSYRLRASLSNHDDSDVSITLSAGAHQVVTLTLPSALEDPPPTDATDDNTPLPDSVPLEDDRWRGGPWVLFGSGTGIAIAGVILWAISYTGSLRDERFETVEDYNDWQYGVYDMALVGDVLVGIGAAAAVAGLIWLAIDRLSDRRPRPERNPTVGALTHTWNSL